MAPAARDPAAVADGDELWRRWPARRACLPAPDAA